MLCSPTELTNINIRFGALGVLFLGGGGGGVEGAVNFSTGDGNRKHFCFFLAMSFAHLIAFCSKTTLS